MNKSLKREIGEGVAWTSLSSFSIKIIGLAYTIIVLANLSVYEFGLIELALSLISLLGILSLGGLQPVIVADLVTYKNDHEFEKMRYLLCSYFSLRLILAFISLLIMVLATYFFKDRFSNEIINLLQILTLTFIASPFRSLILIVFNVGHEFKKLAAFRFVEEIFKLSLLVVMIFVFHQKILAVIVAYVATDFFVTLFFIPTFLRVKNKVFSSKISSIGFFDPTHSYRYHAKWSVFQGAVNIFSQNIKPWIIQSLLGTQAVGIYATATGMYQHISSLVPVSGVLEPIVPLFSKKPTELSRLLNAAIRYQIILLTSVVAMAIIILPMLFDKFFPSYVAAFPLFLCLVITLVPDTFTKVFESVFHALRLQKDLFFANITKLLMVVILLPVFISLFGLYGIAIELFITQACYSWRRYLVLKLNISDYFFHFSYLFKFSEMDKIFINKIIQILSDRLSWFNSKKR